MKRDLTVPKEFKSWRLKLHNKQGYKFNHKSCFKFCCGQKVEI